jgi:hypothetical protein
MAMRTAYLDELVDTLFVVAMTAAIGIGAVNLAVQVNKEKAAFETTSISRNVVVTGAPPADTADTNVIPSDDSVGQLNY